MDGPNTDTVRSIWAHMDRANATEAARLAPECPDCIRGITPEDDICERCLGEGRLLT